MVCKIVRTTVSLCFKIDSTRLTDAFLYQPYCSIEFMVNLSISGPILKCTLRANIGNIDLTIKNINQVQGRLESDSTFCIFGHLAHICRRFRAIFRTFPFYFQFL